MTFPQALLCLLLLVSGPGLAQAPAGDSEPNQSAPAAGAQAPADATDKPDAPDKPDSPPPRDNSPFDYQASEQISEDLSVSFPVDI